MSTAERQSMTFCLDTYKGKEEEMWKDISKFLQIILKNENICTVKQEDFGIVAIDFEHDETWSDPHWGIAQPIWLTVDEQEAIEDYRRMRDDACMEAPSEG